MSSLVAKVSSAHVHMKRKHEAADDGEGPSQTTSQSKSCSSSHSPDGGEKRRRVLGPSLPPAPLEERPTTDPEDNDSASSEDEFGPALPAKSESQVPTEPNREIPL